MIRTKVLSEGDDGFRLVQTELSNGDVTTSLCDREGTVIRSVTEGWYSRQAARSGTL